MYSHVLDVCALFPLVFWLLDIVGLIDMRCAVTLKVF